MLHKAWNSKEEMPYRFPRSSIKFQGHTVQNITDFDPNWAFPDYRPVAAFKSLRFALFKVMCQIWRTHGSKNHGFFYPNWAFPDCISSLESPMATKWCTKLEVALKRCPNVFQCHPSNFKVTRLKKSSNLTQIGRFRTVTPVWIHWWLWNVAQSLKQRRRDALLFAKVIHQISRSHGTKHHRFWPKLDVSGL